MKWIAFISLRSRKIIVRFFIGNTDSYYIEDYAKVNASRPVFVSLFRQVCEKLRLVEKDYFGLKYNGPNGARLWVNMRNAMSVQLSGKPPYRLYLLVKFFVKPQELQQEISR